MDKQLHHYQLQIIHLIFDQAVILELASQQVEDHLVQYKELGHQGKVHKIKIQINQNLLDFIRFHSQINLHNNKEVVLNLMSLEVKYYPQQEVLVVDSLQEQIMLLRSKSYSIVMRTTNNILVKILNRQQIIRKPTQQKVMVFLLDKLFHNANKDLSM